MKKLFISSIAIILLVASCKSIKNVNKKNTNELSLSDYVMCSAPNEIDIVGFVFAVNKKQEKVPITYLNIQKINGDAQLRNITYKRTIDWKILAGFLGTPNINLTANTAFKDSVTVTTNMSFEGSRIDRGLLLDTQNELTEKKAKIIDLIKSSKMQDYKFYLIIETISVTKLNYSFDKKVIGDQELKANFSKVVNVNPNLTWNKNQAFQLDFDLKKPLVTFFKVFPIKVEASLTGDWDVTIDQKIIAPTNGTLFK